MAREDLHRGEDLDRHVPRAALIAPALLLAALLAAPAAAARWHFEQPGSPPFAYSVLFTRSAAGDETLLLLALPGARLVLESRQDASQRDSTESVADPASKERFERRLILSGYEGVPGCASVRPPDACLLFTGANGSVATSLAAFSGEGAKALRARVAALPTPALNAKLTSLAAVFSRSAELLAYGDDFLRLVWPGRFPRSSGLFEKGRRGAGCDFDAGFGYPCDEAERARERARAK